MSRTFNFRLIFLVLGALLLIEAFFMSIAWGVSLLYLDGDSQALGLSSLITFLSGAFGIAVGYKTNKNFGRREAYLIVSLVWVVFSVFGMLPFYLGGSISTVSDAFFETMSGFTTTGSSILTNIEALPHGLLFWRSLTQWLGGMGIIVLSLAILPLFGIGRMQLYAAEATGISYEKLRPKIKDTAKLLWGMYLMLTLVEMVLLRAFGMSFFDAICHSLTTMSTGGYSTKNASIAAFNSPIIEYTITGFMLLAGVNFALLYYLLRGKISRFWNDEEARWYIASVVVCTLIVSVGLVWSHHIYTFTEVESSFRTALFMVVSTVTSTGYATADYMVWSPVLWILMLFLMLAGGSAGSTAGGIKWVRIAVICKNCSAEFKRMVHPNAILPIRINGKAIQHSIIANVTAFLMLYCVLICAAIIFFAFMGVPVDEAVGAAITSVSNIGPGLGASGPAGNFAHFPAICKWVMSLLMVVGRLELFTILLLFTRSFWQK